MHAVKVIASGLPLLAICIGGEPVVRVTRPAIR